MPKPRSFDLSVYFVADPSVTGGGALADIVKLAAQGGATMVQLRDKSGAFDQAKEIRDILKSFAIPLLINDNVHLAKELDADGVHLGQDDMDPVHARAILGSEKIIGVTAFEENHFRNIDPAIVDYAGTGPFYATLTKPGKPVLGAENFSRLVKISPVPVVGIGGIAPDGVASVIHVGAAGVAMMRAISESTNPQLAATNFKNAVAAARMKVAP